ncbi:MAG: hypothetical protein ABI184_01660 [Ginsengibacter sp.]
MSIELVVFDIAGRTAVGKVISTRYSEELLLTAELPMLTGESLQILPSLIH